MQSYNDFGYAPTSVPHTRQRTQLGSPLNLQGSQQTYRNDGGQAYGFPTPTTFPAVNQASGLYGFSEDDMISYRHSAHEPLSPQDPVTPSWSQSDSLGDEDDEDDDLDSMDPRLKKSQSHQGVSRPAKQRRTRAPDGVEYYEPRSRFRRNTKPLQTINLDDATSPAERKRMQNTLAARKTRARREARQLAMEAKNVELRAENFLLKEFIIQAGLLLPEHVKLEMGS